MPVKVVKGKYISFGEEEFKAIRKEGELYILDLVISEEQLNDEKVELLFKGLGEGKSKNVLCKEFNISDYTFTSVCRKHFNTIRVQEIREKLRVKNITEQVKKDLVAETK